MDFTLIFRAQRIIEAYKGLISSDSKVLDVGCGNGVIGGMIRESFGCRMAGADILKYAVTDTPFFLIKDGYTLPFKDGEFDVAMLNDMLHHMPYDNQIRILKEALRVAKTVLIFEVKPTLYAKFTDWLANKIHNIHMRISLTHRKKEVWEELFRGLGVSFETRVISGLAPFSRYPLSQKLAALSYLPVTNYCFIVGKRDPNMVSDGKAGRVPNRNDQSLD